MTRSSPAGFGTGRSRLPSLLFTSYLGKPDATATALRNTWFHTGDAAVLGDDGLLYFVDRLGDRLRVRGENVSSFQVEDLLLGHEAIQLCAVFGVPGAEGDEDDLVACIVPAPEHRGLTEQEVRAYAEANLPKFMRPRLIRIVDGLPRTPTNKVEKYKLRQRVLAELATEKDRREGETMARQVAAWTARTSREGRDSETRDLLLGCAARVFARLGYARTTIADISAEAELGRATFYVYFASKAAVFLAVAHRVRSDILAVHDLPQDVQDDPRLLARASSAAYLRARVDNRELMTVIGHQALDDPDIAAIWHEIRDRPVGRTARHIESLVDQGKARPAVSAEATAHATYGVADRFADLIAADPSTFDQKAAELSAIYLRLLGMDR